MTAKRITAAQFPAELRKRLAEDTLLLRRVALEVCVRGSAAAVAETDRQNLVDQGMFRASWKFVGLPNGAELRNDAPYGGVIEYGRRPNRPGPPLQPILEWTRRKLVGNGEVDEKDAHAVAEAIRWSIHLKGSKPRFVLRKTFRNFRKWLNEALKRELSRGGQTKVT